MISWIRELDDFLRGRKTTTAMLADGQIQAPLRRFLPLAIGLAAAYGFFMGWYSVLSRDERELMQLLASVVKLPALFLLTLLVTFPSLYVFNVLVGCRLRFTAMLRLLVGAVVVTASVAASLGPILAFFTISTRSYSFMVLLNVALLAVAGVVGLGFLMQILRRLAPPTTLPWPQAALSGGSASPSPSTANNAPPQPVQNTGAPQDVPGAARAIFRVWIIIYGLVGAQMGWLLRPFIGSPDLPFTWFRNREGNVFLSVLHHLKHLTGSGD